MLQTYPERFTDGEQIAAMVIPIEPSENGWWYTCRNLQEDGLCAVYETRPAMCREYPYGDQCMFPGCPMYTEPGTGGRDETAVAEHTP
jgi:Fe-S-cluster containining protein